jgi:hypothetical protein
MNQVPSSHLSPPFRPGLWLRLLAIAVGACPFECAAPTYTDCLIECSANGSCPSGLSCNNGLCTAGKICSRRGVEPDASAGGGPPTSAGGNAGRDASSVGGASGGHGGRADAGSGGAQGVGGDPSGTGGSGMPDADGATLDKDAALDANGRNRHEDAARDATSSPDGREPDEGGPYPVKCDLSKPFGTPKRLDSLASAGFDLGLTISTNGLEAYFESTRSSPNNVSQFWRATRTTTDGDFGSLAALWPDASVDQHDPFISSDGKTLFYRSDGDIYASTRSSTLGSFGEGAPLVELNSDANEGDPFVTSDGKTIYFDTMRSGISPDIYKATLVGNTFQNPVPLTAFNTDSSDYNPVLTRDELTIYFTARRPPYPNAFYIWVAHRATRQDDFDPATLVGELAKTLMMWPEAVTDEGCTLYFSMGNSNDYDIYRATKPE